MNELLMDASRIGVRVEERRLPSGLCGIYYEPARLIILDESLPDFQRRCTLCHELVHARHHDNGCGTPYSVKAERRARRQTALRLIDPVEYASAEAICGVRVKRFSPATDYRCGAFLVFSAGVAPEQVAEGGGRHHLEYVVRPG